MRTSLRPLSFIAIVVLAATALLGACSKGPEGAGKPRPTAFACVPPHAYFARRIAGGLVDIHTLVEAGANPHTFEPPARRMARLMRADLYFRAGMPFEDALARKIADGGGPTIIDTRAGINLLEASEHHRDDGGHDEHEKHEARHEHHHAGGEGKDPHVWMSPKLAGRQVATMTDAFCAAWPDRAAAFRQNAAALAKDLAALDAEIARSLAPLKGRTFFVFHPAFGYFAAEYGLVQQAVEVGGKNPSLKDTASLIAKAKARNVRVIFVEPQFSTAAARTIATEIGGAVEPINPLAEDYLANMRRIAADVRQALSGGE